MPHCSRLPNPKEMEITRFAVCVRERKRDRWVGVAIHLSKFTGRVADIERKRDKFKASACKYRESRDGTENTNSLLFRQKDPFLVNYPQRY